MKKLLCIACFVLMFSVPSFAAVIVVQDGTALWPTAPDVQGATPTTTSLTSEGPLTASISQTFTPTTGGNLAKVFVQIDGTGTTNTNDWGLRLVNLGVVSGNPSTYAAGTNLLSSAPAPLAWQFYGWSGKRVVEFDFTGADAVALTAGNMYAFEMIASPSGGALYWNRTGGGSLPAFNPITAGDGYKNRSQLNGAGRDFVFAVVVPEPATIVLLSIGGLAMLRRKKS